MSKIRFQTVTTDRQFEELKELAAKDGHRLDNNSLTPIVEIWRGDKRIGWFHILNQPVLMPCFCKETCSPRDFKEAAEALMHIHQYTSMSQRFPNGTTFMAIPPTPAIDEAIIEKLGFERIHREVWQATP